MANPMFNPDMLKLDGARRVLALLAVAALVDALLIIGMSAGIARAIVALWEGSGLAAALPNAGIFAASYLLRQVLAWLREFGLDRFSRRSARSLRAQLAEHLYDAGPATVAAHGSGSLTTMLVDGIDKVHTYLELGMPKTINLVVIPVVLIIALFFIDVVSAVIALVALPVVFGFMAMLGANARKAAAAQHGEYVQLSNHFADALAGIATLKAFGRAETYAKRVFEASERLRRATVRTLRTATLSSLVLDLIRTFAVAAVAIMLGFRLMAGSVALPPALMALVILPEYFAVVRAFAGDFHATLEGTNQLSAISSLLAESVEAPADPGLGAWGPASRLELDGIACSYADADGVHTALADIALELDGCAKVGLVGTSGAGKSTLARMLAGFSSPSAGTVRVDGVELASLAVPSWRTQVGYIPQSPHVFTATLAENIAFYCPDATADEIAEAAERAGLGELVASLPDGLNTRIGAGGRTLSGGQAQRVALARALVGGGRPVLVLDEPTAHLDIETELALKETMLPLLDGRLVIMATHRLHWMRSMDLLVVLDGGGIAQTGTYDELITADGPFATLVRELGGEA